MNRFVTVLLCLVFLSLSGCNHFGVAFTWADTYIASKVDDYFDISSQQSKSLKNGIQKDLREIKSVVLPKWIQRLKGLQREVAQNSLDSERTRFYFELFMKDVEQINTQFSDTAVDFISSTDSEQLAHFAKTYQKKTTEDLEKFQKTEKYHRDMREKYLEYFEMFLGSLTEEQEKLIDQHLRSHPFPGELKARNKAHILGKYLEQKDSAAEKRNFLTSYYNNPTSLDLPEYRAAYSQYQTQLQKLVIDVLGRMNLKQRQNLLENLNDKTAQLEQIAKAG